MTALLEYLNSYEYHNEEGALPPTFLVWPLAPSAPTFCSFCMRLTTPDFPECLQTPVLLTQLANVWIVL